MRRRDARRDQPSSPRYLAACVLVLPPCALLIGAALAWAAGLRVNLTGSMPIGVYQATSVASATALDPGAIVLACLPVEVARLARERGYVPRGSCPGGAGPIGKIVVAVPGDTVTVTPCGLMVNGRLLSGSQPLARDGHGRPLPPLRRGLYLVRTGEIWLLSAHSPRSFDSRYFGPLGAERVRSVLRTVLPSSVRLEAGTASCRPARND